MAYTDVWLPLVVKKRMFSHKPVAVDFSAKRNELDTHINTLVTCSDYLILRSILCQYEVVIISTEQIYLI